MGAGPGAPHACIAAMPGRRVKRHQRPGAWGGPGARHAKRPLGAGFRGPDRFFLKALSQAG